MSYWKRRVEDMVEVSSEEESLQDRQEPLRIGVFGAGGRVGIEVCKAVVADPSFALVAAVDPRLAGIDLRQVMGSDGAGIQVAASAEALARNRAEVAVDFTDAEAAMENLRWCAANGVHAVVGTTGFNEENINELSELFSSSKANCVMASNFAIGAVLMMRFAEIASLWMDGAEVIEMHHSGKIDAPSGTAMMTAQLMDEARSKAGISSWPGDATKYELLPGARGGAGPGRVRIHSLRLKGLVAHQEVILGATGQTLTIRHDAYDRSAFVPGVLLAAKAVSDHPGLTVGLAPLLGI
jgi:4-hydroxy-tetrahydrodipicolinate reductase